MSKVALTVFSSATVEVIVAVKTPSSFVAEIGDANFAPFPLDDITTWAPETTFPSTLRAVTVNLTVVTPSAVLAPGSAVMVDSVESGLGSVTKIPPSFEASPLELDPHAKIQTPRSPINDMLVVIA